MNIDIDLLRDKMSKFGVTLVDVQNETARLKLKNGEEGFSYHFIRRVLSIRDKHHHGVLMVAIDLVSTKKAETEEYEHKFAALQEA